MITGILTDPHQHDHLSAAAGLPRERHLTPCAHSWKMCHGAPAGFPRLTSGNPEFDLRLWVFAGFMIVKIRGGRPGNCA